LGEGGFGTWRAAGYSAAVGAFRSIGAGPRAVRTVVGLGIPFSKPTRPALKRKLGYYAMPLLWRDQVIGWGNLSVKNGELKSEVGYVGTQPRERAFKRALEAELDRMRDFLKLDHRHRRLLSLQSAQTTNSQQQVRATRLGSKSLALSITVNSEFDVGKWIVFRASPISEFKGIHPALKQNNNSPPSISSRRFLDEIEVSSELRSHRKITKSFSMEFFH